jgi:4-alpha-glucanotransferase
VLAHVTSLPGPWGIGDVGPAACHWIDRLADAGQGWWQVLPLGPTGYGDSPYQCFSAFAGNPLLISPETLSDEDLLDEGDLARGERTGAEPSAAGQVNFDHVNSDHVNFNLVQSDKSQLLAKAHSSFQAEPPGSVGSDYSRFCEREADWLDDYALFMAIKEECAGVSWQDWPDKYRLRQAAALKRARGQLAPRIEFHRFAQFVFFRQWKSLRDYARGRGVRLMGDMPIFVASDSADVWAHPELFQLDAKRRPTVVAGVPPDYFSVTGQLWGNPIYNWKEHAKTGYAWWIARVRAALSQVDLVRLDHFRGFEACWEIPSGSLTAETGKWVCGPGAELFEALRDQLGELPLVAEDLGVITPEVDSLRHRFELPGMQILQFAFGGAREDRFLPHRYPRSTVVYTGTHDNETTAGWYENLTDAEHAFFRRYAPPTKEPPNRQMIRLAWASVADLAIAPLQDILGLGNEARMNLPGRPSGNWGWRAAPGAVEAGPWDWLTEVTEVYQRATPRAAPVVRDQAPAAPLQETENRRVGARL